KAVARVAERTREQISEPDVWLCFAPVKRARIDYIAEKATELGAALLQPVLTQHTVVERVNVERLRANAIEAAEQTERLTVPEVRGPVELARLLAEWPAGRRRLSHIQGHRLTACAWPRWCGRGGFEQHEPAACSRENCSCGPCRSRPLQSCGATRE